ncbi:DUF6012 family protein [uncultured Pseudoalteromonas sp.]|uniref:DUF6012 family protein n=1 Tax=uncultured Pseudoalteromonas sp. TaxID=114053 RepID=UPI002592BC65|nr:DUF6012 family protein [uncultured Pseudoalteromonas sp.]
MKHKTQADRWPCEHKTPCYFNPRFEVIFDGDNSKKEGGFKDTFENGLLTSRVEQYKLPTIKAASLFGEYNIHLERMPRLDEAFTGRLVDLA